MENKREVKDAGLAYIKAGLAVVPARLEWKEHKGKYEKIPIRKAWNESIMSQSEWSTMTPQVVGILTGSLNQNLEAIDFDLKHDLTGKVWDDYTAIMQDNAPELWSKLVIQKTISGGCHIIYRCEFIDKNQHLAREEKGKDAIIETRGQDQGRGSYIVVAPTEGYEFIQGDLFNIPTITREERDLLFTVARTFDLQPVDLVSEIKQQRYTPPPQGTNNSCFKDYNERATVEDLCTILENNFWTIHSKDHEKIFFTRPNGSGKSANLLTSRRVLYVWSNNAEKLPVQEPIWPAKLFILLCHDGNEDAAREDLFNKGYGTRTPEKEAKQTKVKATIETHTGESKEVPPGTNITTAEMKDIYTVVLHKDGNADADELINEITEYYQAGKAVYVQDSETDAHHAGHNVFLSIQWDQYNDAKDDRQRDIIRDAIIVFTDNLNGADKAVYEAAGCQVLDISADHWSDHLKLIHEREAERRHTERKADIRAKIQEAASQGDDEAILKLSRQLENTSAARADFTKQNTIKDLIAERQEEKDRIYSGYIIDKSRLYFPAADVMLVAGYTGMNKTAFLVNLALNAIKNGNEKSKYLFLTMEQSWADVMERFINTYIDISDIGNQINGYTIPNEATIRKYYQSGQDPKHINENVRGEFLKRENEFIQNIWHRINIQYNEDDALSIIETIRRYKEATPELAAVFVDQISFLSLTSEVKKRDRINSRQEELKYIGEKMKSFFGQIKIPMIAAIQISRQGHEKGQANGYNLASLAESGDNERIAHTVVTIEDYNYRTEPLQKKEALEITILKRRGDVINIKEQKKYNAATRAVYNESYNIAAQDANGKIASTKKTTENNNEDYLDLMPF